MTERLYLIDSHLFENQCTVLSCEPAKEGFDVMVDRTVFFPNKGGQPCDTGILGGVKVVDVRESGDELILRTDGPLPVGAAVTGHIDEERRGLCPWAPPSRGISTRKGASISWSSTPASTC